MCAFYCLSMKGQKLGYRKVKDGPGNNVKITSFILNWFKRRRAPAGLILLYHRVTDLNSDPWQLCVSPRNFEQQMQLLRETCSPDSIGELASLLEAKHPPRMLNRIVGGVLGNNHRRYGMTTTTLYGNDSMPCRRRIGSQS